jgi:hypothetical protein
VDVFNPGDVGILSSPGWNKTEEAKANITLERIGDSGDVKVFWNGFADPGIRIKPGPVNCLVLAEDELVKVIRHAAWFKHVVGSLVNSLSLPLFEAEFREFDEATKQSTGVNLLADDLVRLEDNEKRTFCLVLRNVSKFEIWPFVFSCDPSKFKIGASW